MRITLPPLEGYTLTSLTFAEEPVLQALCERCADYIELVAGLPPSLSLAHDLYTVLPEGKSEEDKLLLGIFAHQSELVGVLDAVRDHPHQGEWFLGLLMLEPAHRGHGLGKKIYGAFEQWAAAQGAQAVRLSVAQQNEAAYQFWLQLGFEEMEWLPPKRFGAKESTFILMRRKITPQHAV